MREMTGSIHQNDNAHLKTFRLNSKKVNVIWKNQSMIIIV